MTDLQGRFRVVDGLEAPDLWTEASRRARDELPARRVGVGPVVPWSRLRTIAVAFAVFVGAAVFAWDVATPDRAPRPEPAIDLAAELPTGWSELPAPPEVRTGAAAVWTGTELLVWGGNRYEEGFGEGPLAREGLSFDAATRGWGTFPHGPLSGRRDPAAVWTGSELLVWGGSTGECCLPSGEDYLSDGAAFDPRTGGWRALPPAPIDGRIPFSVWTGDELLVWGNAEWGFTLRDGAAYDPATDGWRTIPEAPVDINDGAAVWTGEEMIVFGAARRSGAPVTDTAVGIAYSPTSDRWRELPPSDLSPNAMTAAWLGEELVAWDYLNQSQAYTPASDRWRALGRVPLGSVECPPKAVATADVIVGDYCGSIVAFSQEGRWRREPLPVGGCCRLNEVVPADGVVLVLSSAVEREALEPGARRLFAYNPVPLVRGDLRGEVLEPEPFFPATERDGDLLRMPVVFPDGTRATLAYPISLGLQTMGVQPRVSYVWGRYPAPRFNVVFLHDPDASIAGFVRDERPIDRVGGSGGIEVWRARGNDVNTSFWLRYRLPSWTVLAPVWNIDGAIEDVVDSLEVQEAPSGFPAVGASGALSLAEGYGEAEGAVLSIGSFGDPAARDALIELSPDGCSTRDRLSPSHETASMCLAHGNVFVNISGDPPLVEDVFASLRVEDFVGPSMEVEPTPFIPEMTVEDGVARVPVTFPDGASATLVYPAELDLASRGIQPDTTYDSPRTGLVPIMFIHGPPGVEHDYVIGSDPEVRIAGPVSEEEGPTGLWRSVPLGESSIDPVYWLLYRRGEWTILVGVATKVIAQDVADSLIPHVDHTGMPWIEARAPFELSPFAGEGGGTNLAIGDLEPSPRSGRFAEPDFPFIDIHYNHVECRDDSFELTHGDGGAFASICTGGGAIRIDLDGPTLVLRELAEGLRIESFRQAP